jgi:hypothetical protein
MAASLVEAPAQSYVRVLSHVPDVLRPGLFLAGCLVLAWFVFKQGGIAVAWHALLRTLAIGIELLVAALLVPEYVWTARRRRQGRPPAGFAVAAGDVAEVVLDGADRLHERHRREPPVWRSFPWKASLLLVAAGAAVWIAMEHVPDGGVSTALSQSFDRWRDVEVWADVPPDRLAEPGPASDAAVVLPAMGGMTHDGRKVLVRFYCGNSHRCAAKVTIVTGRERPLTSRSVQMAPATSKVFHFTLTASAARRAKHVAVMVKAL